MLPFDEIRFHSQAINASFPNMSAYAIRPYTCSIKTKQIHNEYIIIFPHVRAYAIRPYTYSIKLKHITTKYFLEKLPFHHTLPANNIYSIDVSRMMGRNGYGWISSSSPVSESMMKPRTMMSLGTRG